MLESVCVHNAYLLAVDFASQFQLATAAAAAEAATVAANNDDIVVIFRLLTRTLLYLIPRWDTTNCTLSIRRMKGKQRRF